MGKDLASSLRPALVMTLLFAVLLGLLYPLALTGIGQLLFPHQANGSLIEENGKVQGRVPMLEVGKRAELPVHGGMPALLASDRPGTPCVVRQRLERVVLSLAELDLLLRLLSDEMGPNAWSSTKTAATWC